MILNQTDNYWIVRTKDHTCYLLHTPQQTEKWIGGCVSLKSTLENQKPTFKDESAKYSAPPIMFMVTIPKSDIQEQGSVGEWQCDDAEMGSDEEAVNAFLNFLMQTAERYIPHHPFAHRQDGHSEFLDERQEDCWECGSDNARLLSIDTLSKLPTTGHIMECFDCDYKDIYLQEGGGQQGRELYKRMRAFAPLRAGEDSAIVLVDHTNGEHYKIPSSVRGRYG